jgi:hypothetical protein
VECEWCRTPITGEAFLVELGREGRASPYPHVLCSAACRQQFEEREIAPRGKEARVKREGQHGVGAG